ncbi:hypothetical protein CQ018_13205 [Arthrobacter sp. MYb227]|nr:hypothetical protein CQ018_13205 [Arthrobacter sp. MYb227]
MTQNPQTPPPRQVPISSGHVRAKHHFSGLVLGGALTALLFLLFIFVSGVSLDGTINPLWIGVIIGVMVAALGVFRILRGPAAFGLGDVEHKHEKP